MKEKTFGAVLTSLLLEASAIVPSENGQSDGLDKFEAGTKTYNDAIKSIVASAEKMPRGQIKSIVSTD